jgi:hypothetical protein
MTAKEQTWLVNVHGPEGVAPLLQWRCDWVTALALFLQIADNLNTRLDAPISLENEKGRELMRYDNRNGQQPKGNPCHN